MVSKLCTLCHQILSCESSLNNHVKNIHGIRCDACKESKFGCHRKSGMLYGDVLGDKDLHGESEIGSIDKFATSRQVIQQCPFHR